MTNWAANKGISKVQKFKLILLIIFLTASLSGADELEPLKLSPADKCPVCGMFVAKYPDFVARIVFKDGTPAFFDGVKDMLKYYFNLPKYNPAQVMGDIKAISVTDYYTLSLIDGLKSYYVIGSDVYGPMGKELIPFQEEAAAQEFLKDHTGKAVLQFKDLKPELLIALD
jgi:copper chaperone NosL